MNNIYVDELPKSCFDCDCPYTDDYIDNVPLRCPVCAWDWGKQKRDTEVTGYNKSRHKDCPLKPLSDRLAEERKKVIERIRDLAEIYTEPSAKGFDFETYILTEENLNKILDKVERWGEQL